ncbi:DUF2628 domain-containing protein [Rhizobiaceae bacterium BDR2-2]|uniref:DUF2628 domain-containing protein n=1 Tax=Ectorhizobium quercum TaxID=2965071 RepID=A0AAE3N1V9_9HYPH|nr:DUF2628 domain-containing protein [Ectorhizobium quercum]MCX8999453.1 DUF2628 domain-containing protein [Ectorhizobium quercum]
MASFVFLTPPGSVEGDERTAVVRDGFSFLAYFLPPLWFLLHRLWFEAFLTLLLLALSGILAGIEAAAPAGPVLALAVSVFSGLESRNLAIRKRERHGYRIAAAIVARNLDEAEEIFFSGAALRTRTPVNSAGAAPAAYAPVGDRRPVLGLFDLHGGR